MKRFNELNIGERFRLLNSEHPCIRVHLATEPHRLFYILEYTGDLIETDALLNVRTRHTDTWNPVTGFYEVWA